MTPQPVEKPSDAVRLLKALSARRTQILQQLRQESNRQAQTHCDQARQLMDKAIEFYEQPYHQSLLRITLERGKVKKVALVACMRKLLTIMNSMVRNNEPWREPQTVVA